MPVAAILLFLALMLSWPRFAVIFRTGTASALATAPLTIVASAIALSSAGLAFANQGLLFGALLVFLSVAFARTVPAPLSTSAVVPAGLCLLAYLQITGMAAA